MALPLIAGLLGGLLSASPTLPKSEVVNLGYNQYQGVSLHNGVDQYLGMRYAKPPVNDLRFRGPQDPEHSKELLDASSVRLQSSASTRRVFQSDALTIPVWARMCRRWTVSQRFVG